MQFFPDFKTFVTIGPVSIHYYAIVIILGALIAYAIGQYRFKQLGYAKGILSDYFFGLLLIGILGARIWYVIFMWNKLYAANPIEAIAIWHGGLAIQGGIVAGLIYSWYFFKRKEIPFLIAGDAIMPGVLIAQACGRWGNFFNHEAYGTAVSLSFLKTLHIPQFIINQMYINGAYHHPTFLYESLGNIIVFLLIILVVRRFSRHNGAQFFAYFIGYGIVRFFVEGLRTDSLMLGPIRMAQLTSVAFLIIGILGEIYVFYKGTNKTY